MPHAPCRCAVSQLPCRFFSGNPDVCDQFGYTALHHAAANGRLNCVTFLVSFGVNLWALDNQFHTALEVAALRAARSPIVRHLDAALAKQASLNRKLTAKLRERAALEARKRVKLYDKAVEKARAHADREDTRRAKCVDDADAGSTVRSKRRSCTTDGPMLYSSHFTAAARNKPCFGFGGVAKKVTRHKNDQAASCDELRISETNSDGRRTIRSYSGLRGSDANVVLMGHSDAASVCALSVDKPRADTVSRAMSEPDFYYGGGADSGFDSCGSLTPESAGMFDRPGFGSVTFLRHHAPITSIAEDDRDTGPSTMTHAVRGGLTAVRWCCDSIGSVGSLAVRAAKDSREACDVTCAVTSDVTSDVSVRQFLAANGLVQCCGMFAREQIDMQALLLLTEADLRELGLAMGPRRKLMAAIDHREAATTTIATTATTREVATATESSKL